MINRLRQIKTNKVHWIHILKPSENEIQFLRDHFEFHPLDLEDCLNTAQRPKVDEYEKYIFLILLFPFYVRTERSIFAAEIDFFIGANYLITVSDGNNELTDQFFDECLKSEVLRDRYLSGTPTHLLYEIVNRLQSSMLPMLDHISQDNETIEKQMFAGAEKRMVRDILLIKRNIVNFRRIVNAHKSTIKKLMSIRTPGLFALSSDLNVYFQNIVERSRDIWEILEIHSETINAFHAANDSLISFKLNEAMRVLTVLSVSIFAATLIATILGMNTASNPIVRNPYGFWIVVFIIGLVMVTLHRIFKRKDWL